MYLYILYIYISYIFCISYSITSMAVEPNNVFAAQTSLRSRTAAESVARLRRLCGSFDMLVFANLSVFERHVRARQTCS